MGMTVTLTGYSALFMRFAWAVQPENYILSPVALSMWGTNEPIEKGHRV